MGAPVQRKPSKVHKGSPLLKPQASGASFRSSVSAKAPSAQPPFTVGDLRSAIPAHCFKRSFTISSLYLLVDLALVCVLFYLASFIDTIVSNDTYGAWAPLLRHVCWTAYWILQGGVMTGLWVVGHECGHGGYAESEMVGDAVGLVVHSALLVPYFSWKISHRRHHSNTGNMARDEVFVPRREHEASDNPLYYSAPVRFAQILITLTLGWPFYLLANVTGHEYPKGAWVNHFMPSSPIFSARERKFVVLSDICLLVAVSVLYKTCVAFSFTTVFYMYGMPYLVVNFWLVLITLLQHSHPSLPHYEDEEWDWLRGALATVDRDYWLGNILFHHIGDTHVAHHLFSTIPHYHAQEATEAIKPVLGKYYQYDSTPIAKALWNCYKDCSVVGPEPETGDKVLWFKSYQS